MLRESGRSGEVSVVFVDDPTISEIHREYFDDASPTDVITFPFDEDLASLDPHDVAGRAPLLGELVVSVETAKREALRRKVSPEQEAGLYVIHGVLHLLGYDDRSPDETRKMRRAERKYLRLFASSSP